MKVCPKCGSLAADPAQSFCLVDGTPLVEDVSSEPTVTIDNTRATVLAPRKKRTGMWVGLTLVGLAVLGIVIGGLMYVAYRMGTQSVDTKVSVGSNAQSPRPSVSPKQTGTAVTPSSTASPGSTSSETDTSSDEVVPITWSTTGSTFKNDAGLRYTFLCPPDGAEAAIWGSDVYTADSSICTAAVHAGRITLEKGGEVTIEFTGGRAAYGATTRNGITSNNFGKFDRSYVFKDKAWKSE